MLFNEKIRRGLGFVEFFCLGALIFLVFALLLLIFLFLLVSGAPRARLGRLPGGRRRRSPQEEEEGSARSERRGRGTSEGWDGVGGLVFYSGPRWQGVLGHAREDLQRRYSVRSCFDVDTRGCETAAQHRARVRASRAPHAPLAPRARSEEEWSRRRVEDAGRSI